jgi:hypothetical protein
VVECSKASRYKIAGFSGGSGQMQKLCKIHTRLSSPPWPYQRADDFGYVRCVSELNEVE